MRRRWGVIAELVHQHGLRIGAEIGVAEGRFSAGLLSLCPGVRLWGFDPYQPGYQTWMGTQWDERTQQANRSTAQNVVRNFRPRFTLVEKSSLEASAWLSDASLDFVFIDADHDYEAVKADIAAWLPKIKASGWITGHDYDTVKFPGVVRAVEESFADFSLGEDHVWMAPAP
jgi:hypothetical protein